MDRYAGLFEQMFKLIILLYRSNIPLLEQLNNFLCAEKWKTIIYLGGDSINNIHWNSTRQMKDFPKYHATGKSTFQIYKSGIIDL